MKIEELIERHEEAAKSFPNSFENHAAIAALLRELVAARQEITERRGWAHQPGAEDDPNRCDCSLCQRTFEYNAARLASDRAMESKALEDAR